MKVTLETPNFGGINRKLHLERQKLIQMWEDAIELIHQRDKDIHKMTAEFANNKGHLRRGRRILDNLDLKYYNAVEHNVR